MTVHGVRTVTRLEFRVRLRTGRWRWLLAAWTGVIAGFMVLLRVGLERGNADTPFGTPMFGGLMLFVLALALLVAPALTAQSVNGDRERGTLATLQTTQLSAAEIAAGKLLAAWATACVFLALTLPFVVWSMLEGGVGAVRASVVLAVVALLLGVVAALAQALSALFVRSITSALLSYVTVFTLTVGTLIGFGLGVAVTSETRTVTETLPPASVPAGPDGTGPPPGIQDQPQTETYQVTDNHPERVWWLLALNPFVVLADAAPQLPARIDSRTGEERAQPLDPLGEIGRAVREVRTPDPGDGTVYPGTGPMPEPEQGAVWPYGFAANLALGAAALAVTTRRLRTPSHSLPRGVRVA